RLLRLLRRGTRCDSVHRPPRGSLYGRPDDVVGSGLECFAITQFPVWPRAPADDASAHAQRTRVTLTRGNRHGVSDPLHCYWRPTACERAVAQLAAEVVPPTRDSARVAQSAGMSPSGGDSDRI